MTRDYHPPSWPGRPWSVAHFMVDGKHLVVRLSTLEKLGALRGDARLPMAGVRAVRVSERPWSELRGIRAPGTGCQESSRSAPVGGRNSPTLVRYAGGTREPREHSSVMSLG